MKQRQIDAIDFFISDPFRSAVLSVDGRLLFRKKGKIRLWIVRQPSSADHWPSQSDDSIQLQPTTFDSETLHN
jgi:hypothetical protein